MATQSFERDPVEELAEEFLARHRRGENPSLTEYTRKYPELADQIHDLFPALLLMEKVGTVAGQPTGPAAASVEEGGAIPAQLGEYRILRMVGRGGMGVVYEAVQESLGRHVALKVLPFPGLISATQLERFRREARAAAALHHTNIVPVFGVGEHQGVHYYAMQFIQGQSLDIVLKELRRLRAQKHSFLIGNGLPAYELTVSVTNGLLTGRFQKQAPEGGAPSPLSAVGPAQAADLPPAASVQAAVGAPLSGHLSNQSDLVGQSETQYFRRIAQLGVQVADALTYAHQNNILHRDIKPANLLLDTRGIVWITDFGLAKAEGTDELTRTGEIVGILRYMAPERFQGHCDPRSDIYGLGISLYELLTLQPAMTDVDRARLIARVTHEDPVRPRQVDPHIPRDLETIILKAMAKDPRDRYGTAEDLAQDLRRFLSDKPIHARRAGLPERAWRLCRRNPAVAILTLTVAALLVAVAGGSLIEVFRIAADRDAIAAARDEADRNAGQADQARQLEERQRKRAEEIVAESNRRLARLCVANGGRLLDEGDGLGALVWFAEALNSRARATHCRTTRTGCGWRRLCGNVLAFSSSGHKPSLSITSSSARMAATWPRLPATCTSWPRRKGRPRSGTRPLANRSVRH